MLAGGVQEATEQHKPLHHHLAHPTVHGLLHCLVMITNRTQKLRAWRFRNCDPRRLGHCTVLSLNCALAFLTFLPIQTVRKDSSFRYE